MNKVLVAVVVQASQVVQLVQQQVK